MNSFIHKLNFFILNVGYAVHDNDWNWNDIRSPFARLYLVTKGKGRLKLDSGTYDLTPGHLYLIPSFVLHSDICDGVFEHYYLHIYEDSNSEDRFFEDLQFPLEVAAEDIDSLLFKRICELNPMMKLPHSNPVSYDNDHSLFQNIQRNKLSDNYKQIESEGIVFQLVSRFLKDAKAKEAAEDNRIQNALIYIRKNINSQLDIDQLSKIAFLSRDHFIRLFKKEVGQTPLNYITQRKIEKAELILATTDIPVKQIAYDLGYDDNSYFNRLFKNKIGITPQQYRERRKK